jgi:cytoskeletal protein RodZ
MDKFDEMIKESKPIYQPKNNNNFVEKTMAQITPQPKRKAWNAKLWAPIAVGGFAVLLLGFIFVPKLWQSNAPASQDTQTSVQTDTNAQQTPATAVSNSDLESDLGNIGGSMNQESSDQSTANTALNDSQQQIAVPQE